MVKQEHKKTHVSESKKNIVGELSTLMKKNTVMIVSIKGLPAAQFQDMKKKLRGQALIKVSKSSLIDLALEHAKNEALNELVKYVSADTAILFSDKDAFEISAFLNENKSPAKAKAGQEATEDIIIKAGPTTLLPGPDISALSSVGLQPKVEGGKISIAKEKVLIKKGEKISSEKASILAKLDITPFKIGLEPIAAFTGGKVFGNIKVDKEATLKRLGEAYGRSVAFAVSLSYISMETLPFVLGKAVAHEKAINALIKTEAQS